MSMWRDDNLEPKGMATISTVVLCAIDRIQITSDYAFLLCHVKGFHGKGFMYSVRSRYGGSMCNSEVFYGIEDANYIKCFDEGKSVLLSEQAKLDKMFETQMSLQEKNK